MGNYTEDDLREKNARNQALVQQRNKLRKQARNLQGQIDALTQQLDALMERIADIESELTS